MSLDQAILKATRHASPWLALALLSTITALALSPVTATAQTLPTFGAPASNVKVELVAAADAVVPGQPVEVGLKLSHSNGWHTYWQVPGDSGLPTQINWQLPPGFSAGPIEWPHPQRLPLGPLMNFGYKGDTLLLTTIRTPSDFAVADAVTLKAKAEWLECREVCIPGSTDVALTLPVRSAAKPSPLAGLFASARALVPQPLPGLTAHAVIDGGRLKLGLATLPDRRIERVEFFPLEEARIEPAAAQLLRHEAGQAVLYLTAAKPAAAEFTRLKGVVVANGGPAVSERLDQYRRRAARCGHGCGGGGHRNRLDGTFDVPARCTRLCVSRRLDPQSDAVRVPGPVAEAARARQPSRSC